MFSENEVASSNQLGGRRARGTEVACVCRVSSVKKNVNSENSKLAFYCWRDLASMVRTYLLTGRITDGQ